MIRKTVLILVSIAFLSALFPLESQENRVEKLRKESIELMNNGKFEKSIEVIDEALEIEPNNIVLLYEKSLAHYKLENYQEVIAILTPLKDRPDAFEQIYQLLGNSYDFEAKKYTAIDIYNEGLEKFPNSGRLYMELGIAELGNENKQLAITYFERGIMAQPDYPNNYYHLSILLEEDNYNIYALIYAETFMNYVKNEDKFRETNKLIYDIYNELFTYEENKLTVNYKRRFKNNDFVDNYINTLVDAYINVEPKTSDKLSIKEINDIRTEFISIWFEKYPDTYKSKILLRQKDLVQNSHFEAYNYWLMSDGDLDEFKNWIESNYQDYDKLLVWLRNNKLKVESIIDLFPKI